MGDQEINIFQEQCKIAPQQIFLWRLWSTSLEDFMNRLDRRLSEVIGVKSKSETVDVNDLWRVLQALCFSFFVVTGGGFLDPKHLWHLDA